MAYKVAIRCNATGEVRVCELDLTWADDDERDDGPISWWTTGNFGCDCNRHLVFHRVNGGEPEDDVPCGETLYAVLYAELPDGRRVPIDEGASTQNLVPPAD